MSTQSEQDREKEQFSQRKKRKYHGFFLFALYSGLRHFHILRPVFWRLIRRVVRLEKAFTQKLWVQGTFLIWIWALFLGIVGGYAVLAFLKAIRIIHTLAWTGPHGNLGNSAENPITLWFWGIPVLGGFIVAFMLYIGRQTKILQQGYAPGVAETIEARALKGGHIPLISGLYSALVSAMALGFGASAGREGPAVHLGASLGSGLSRKLGLPPRAARTLLACGAASAVAASFNAPLAGALFAFEVILGHYALSVIAPVTISAVTGTLVARAHLGAAHAFSLPPDMPSVSFIDFPAILVFGFIASFGAILFMRLTLKAPGWFQILAERIRLPLWLLPVPGGLGVGFIGVFFPQVLGVGYEATVSALTGHYGLILLITLFFAKIIATAWCLGCRFGAGVFSPSLYLGAMLGGSFGIIMTWISGGNSAGESFYAIVGMGALSGAVLGAPISTTLILFELTSSYETAIAVMVSVSMATVITQAVMGGSFFQKQIGRRGRFLRDGPQRILLQIVRVRDFMTPLGPDDSVEAESKNALFEDDTLGRALGFLEAEGLESVMVKTRHGDQAITGYIQRTDALMAYNKALIATHEEQTR